MATATAAGSPAQTPLADPDTWIGAEDYPVGMPSGGGQANVEFDISTQGRVENCRGRHAMPTELSQFVCVMLEERARYEPAYDSEGRAMSSRGLHSVRWVEGQQGLQIAQAPDYGGAVPRNNPGSWISYMDVPQTQLRRGGAGTVSLRFDITAEGRVSNCSGHAPEEDANLARHFCQILGRRARFRSPIGRDGNPYATNGRTEVSWCVGQSC